MTRWISNWRGLFFVVLTAAALGLSGCASTEPDNLSERPWNSPRSWENGLPIGITEGH